MKFIAVAFIVFAAVSQAALDPASEWISFKTKFNKHYINKVEEEVRMRIFKTNVERINNHNKKYELGLSTYKRGLNTFSDLSFDEISKSKIGSGVPKQQIQRKKNLNVQNYAKNLPDTVDWRDTKGVVSDIKDQGNCASGWAFSATGGIEGQWFLTRNESVLLSEQNLVDCVTDNYGCDNGLIDFAFKYVISNKGIDTEVGYPYKAIAQDCQYDAKSLGATVSSYTFTGTGSERSLQRAVANVGPVSVFIDADHQSFFDYTDGIWDEPNCRPDLLSHAVLVIGYGTDNGVDYWLVKNSFGTNWGMQGYFKMRRNNHNQCGITSFALFPVV